MNLASHPFRRERTGNAVCVAACVALLCSLLVLTSLTLSERGQAAQERRAIDAQTAEMRQLQRKESQFQSVLARPQNADVFAVSVFLNELIARRAVSWTRVFRDLGTVLPGDMRLEVIRLPQIPAQEANGTNHVQLDMVVAAKDPAVVLTLLKHLEQSPLFGSVSVVSQTPPTQNDPNYKYRVTVAYAQKL